MIQFIKNKILESSFNRKFKFFNQYTRRAFHLKTDEQLKEYSLKCIREIAKENKKEITSLSLDDVYRVLCKIRKKTPGLLRKITLKQVIQIVQTTDKAGYASNLIYALAYSTPLPLTYIPLKFFLGKKIKYVFVVWIVTLTACELYKRKKT